MKFYIKPQHGSSEIESLLVVSYWNSTSNHNNEFGHNSFCNVVSYWNSTSNHNAEKTKCAEDDVVSYWNSTSNHNFTVADLIDIMLYLIEILHQTTTRHRWSMNDRRCILLKFYIKPQLIFIPFFWAFGCILLKFYIKPQLRCIIYCIDIVVSYWNSTSNHNWIYCS